MPAAGRPPAAPRPRDLLVRYGVEPQADADPLAVLADLLSEAAGNVAVLRGMVADLDALHADGRAHALVDLDGAERDRAHRIARDATALDLLGRRVRVEDPFVTPVGEPNASSGRRRADVVVPVGPALKLRTAIRLSWTVSSCSGPVTGSEVCGTPVRGNPILVGPTGGVCARTGRADAALRRGLIMVSVDDPMSSRSRSGVWCWARHGGGVRLTGGGGDA